MNFDELLDFLFHRIFGICITIASSVLLMLALTGCLPNDFIGCFWQGCGCNDCADVCYDCSKEENDCYYDCLGGKDSCALVQCLFGPSGCEEECGDCYVDCGGANSDCFKTVCYGDGFGEGCYEVDGHSRYTCMNCTAYCDGVNDPDSPNFQRVFLFNITLVDAEGNMEEFEFYQNTKSLGSPSADSGMKFMGYFSEPDGEGQQYTDSNGQLIIKPSQPITLYAHFVDAFVGLEFIFEITEPVKSTNETLKVDKEFSVVKGDSLIGKLPKPEVIDGYTFKGWYTTRGSNLGSLGTKVGNEDGILTEFQTFNPSKAPFNFSYNDTSRPDNVVKIVPYYTPTVYTVTVVYPNELSELVSSSMNPEYEKKYGDLISDIKAYEDDKITKNYKFIGFAKDAGGNTMLDEEAEVTGSMTIYAIYRKWITLSFEEKHGDVTYTKTYYEGEVAKLPEPKNINPGDQFEYWYAKGTNAAVKYTTITVSEMHEDIVFVPYFKVATYKITYLNSLGEKYSEATYKMGDNYEILTPAFGANPYENFLYWIEEGTDKRYNGGDILSETKYGDITLKMVCEPKEFNINLNSMGGTLNSYTTTAKYGKAFTIEVPKRTGYTFMYWYYVGAGGVKTQITNSQGKSQDKDGNEVLFTRFNGASYSNDTTLDITFIAEWKKNDYTITFKGNDGTADLTVPYQHKEVLSRPSKTPSKPGYTFIGWYWNGNNIDDQFDVMQVTQDMTIEAKFKANTYKINFVVNGGEFSGGETTFTINYTYNEDSNYKISGIPEVTANEVDYSLYGWYQSQDPSLTDMPLIQKNGQVMQTLKALLAELEDGAEFTVYAGIFSDY